MASSVTEVMTGRFNKESVIPTPNITTTFNNPKVLFLNQKIQKKSNVPINLFNIFRTLKTHISRQRIHKIYISFKFAVSTTLFIVN